MAKQFKEILGNHSFFKDLKEEYLELLAGCCSNKVFEAGELLGHEGEPANHFYLIREGKVAIQMFAPNQGAMTLHTVGHDDVIGWSWLFPPYKWNFDIKALEKTRTIALDAKCLRQKCDDNPDLGYPLMKKFSQIMIQRLKETRIQILDIYKSSPPSEHADF